MDISHELIDGITHLERVPKRYLHSTYQKDVYKYKQFVIQEFQSHNIIEKAFSLYSSSGPIKEENEAYKTKLNELDRLVLAIQLKAEKECCKHRTKLDWSDSIHYQKMILKYWNVKRKKTTRRINTDSVCLSIYNSLPKEYSQYIDIATGSAFANWIRSKKVLRKLMVSQRTLLTEIKEDLQKDEATARGITIEQVQKQQDQRRKDKRLYNTLRHHFHPTTRSGISYILTPDKDVEGNPTTIPEEAATWHTETSPDIVLDKIFHRNVQHFGQSQGTPFTIPPLSDHLGYSGMTSRGTTLIQEGINLPNTESLGPHTQDILQQLSATPECHQTHDTLVTFDGFCKAIKKWRESTSTSPSGKHLGHYKSLLSLDSQAKTYSTENPDPGPVILEVLYQLACSAFNSSILLDRWKNITTCMIEKLPGVPKINKLRVIHLYEADYNLMNKLIWQRGIVWEAHKNNLLNPSQAGSRPYHTSIEVVFSKDLKYLHSSLTRRPMATLDNDAKSCYDRIVAALALLVSHKFGAPESYCKTVGTTLQHMQFCIRTAMGDSKETYSHSSETPIYGVGQGGTASPALWLLVSSLLIDCYQKIATGMHMTSPTGKIVIHQCLEALVDDTSIFTNLPNDTNISELVLALEKDAQNWERYLSASGGCLELTMCFYYVLAWSFNAFGETSPMSVEEINQQSPPVFLQEFNKQVQTQIAIKGPSDAHRTLGVWKTMTGNVAEQIKFLKQRSTTMANIVSTSGMYPYQADISLRMIYTPSMTYCLPAVDIPQSTLDKIQYKALESFIPAMGFNKGFPRAIMFGMSEYGGEEVPHLFTESKLRQIEIIMMHTRANTTIGKLFLLNLDWIQLHIGRSTPLFASKQPITYMKNMYTSLHKFLLSINGQLHIKNTYVPQLERQGDICIMDAIIERGCNLSASQYNRIHSWRLFYQVETLSDITNAGGDKILDVYLKFPTNSDILSLRPDRVTKLLWPIQPAPTSRTSFNLWSKCLKHCFTSGSNSLKTPLGNWIVSPSQSNSTWQAYTNDTHQSMILKMSTEHLLFETIISSTTRTRSFDKSQSKSIDQIPDTFFPTQITQSTTAIKLHHNRKKSLAAPYRLPPTPTDIQDAISQAPVWLQHILQHFRIHDIDAMLSGLLQTSLPILLVSDGGYKDDKGSFGVAIGTPDHALCSIEGPAPGTPHLLTSFRSEAYGMLAGLAFMHIFINTYNLVFSTTRPIKVFCDNLAVVNICKALNQGDTYPSMYIKSDMDIIIQLQYELESLKSKNVKIIIDHVSGHQDDYTTYDSLPRPNQLNVDADSYATNYLCHGIHHAYEELPNNPINLYINDNLIHRDIKRQIRTSALTQDLREYMIKRFEWKTNIPDKIWWQVHGSSIKSFSRNDKLRIRKLIFHWLPTHVQLQHYYPTIDVTCQSCNSFPETHTHLYTCPCADRQTVKDNWFDRFEDFLSNELYTPPLLRQIFMSHTKPVCYPGETREVFSDLPIHYAQACSDQNEMGWHQLFKGRMSIQWGNIIASHLSENKVSEKIMTALIWGRKVVKMILRLGLDIWIQRNETCHFSYIPNESPVTRQRLFAQIEALQQSNPPIRYCDRDFVFKPLEVLRTYSLSNLVSWYRAAVNILKVQKQYRLTTESCLIRATTTAQRLVSLLDINDPTTTDIPDSTLPSIHDPDNPCPDNPIISVTHSNVSEGFPSPNL